MKEPLAKTVSNTLMVMVTVAIFLLIISSYDRSSMSAPEYRHAAEASHGEEPKPRGHGR
jgi:hypothetical protein